MNRDGLKLTVYFGERARAGGAFLADALADVFARHELETSVVLRGAEGFGAGHRLRTDRLLTLSEDLPLVCVAVDTPERVEAALRDVERLRLDGLVTLERARLLTGPLDPVVLAPGLHEATKLTLYAGRHERVGGTPVHEAVVAALHRHGVAGATVLLGVDGTAHGERERAGLLSRNARVPLMVVAVGDGARIGAALPELGGMLARPLATLERLRVCKRDGALLAGPQPVPDPDERGLATWQKLMVYCGEQSRHRGRPLHAQLVRALREAGAAGATSVRGIWGYHGDHLPHGDAFWRLRRRVPVVVVVVDTPERVARWFEIVDRHTDETGLVTSELVPAYRARGRQGEHGGLRLARRAP